MAKSKICVLSGRYPASKFHGFINHKIYCYQHDYTYIYCNWPNKCENKYYNKLYYLKEYLSYFDYIFWIDDDAFFMNFDISLENFLPDEAQFLSICACPDFRQLKTKISSGQFLIKSTPESLEFVNKLINTNLEEVKKWWSEEMGYYTGGDQDAFVYHMYGPSKYLDKVKIWNYSKFNSRVPNYFEHQDHDVFLLHFTGTKKIKWNNYKRIQNLLGRAPDLVDEKYKDGWNLQKPFFSRILNKLGLKKQ